MFNPMCEIYTHFPAEGNSWEENNTLYVYEQFQNSIAFFSRKWGHKNWSENSFAITIPDGYKKKTLWIPKQYLQYEYQLLISAYRW